MGNDLTKGTTYVDGGMINAANLNAHVDDATFKSTCISARTLKTPMAVTDELLINDSGTLKKVTGSALSDIAIPIGAVVQTIIGTASGYGNIATVIPADDTLPQITEGTVVVNSSITPRYANSRIIIRVSGQISGSAALVGVIAVFRDTAGANAIVSRACNVTAVNMMVSFNIIATDLPATVSTIVYSVRMGPGSGTLYINGNSTTRLLGGSSITALEIQEVRV
jgi:hypothetical protein